MTSFLGTVFLLLLSVIFVRASSIRMIIPGPRSYRDRIAIVGAGPSGVHMAYLLQQKGFRNIEILEKTSRIGGKSQTIFYRGAPQEIGTVYISPDYKDNIVELVKKFVPGDLVNLPPASIWLDGKEPITYTQYIINFVKQSMKTNDTTVILRNIFQTLQRYIKLHETLFGSYDGELMAEPLPEVMKQIGGTFQQFLADKNMMILTPIFQASTTVQGYGQINNISAIYGLMWNTPRFMRGFLNRLAGTSDTTGNFMLRSGFQNLWEEMVRKEDIRVTYNVNILRVYRNYENGCRNVWILSSVGRNPFIWKYYDFLIWSPEMKTSLPYWINNIPLERKLFSSAHAFYFTASIVNSENEIRGQTPIDYWIENIQNNRQHSVWAQRDSFSSINQHGGLLYKNGEHPTGNDNKKTKTNIVYQIGRYKPTLYNLQNILVKHFKKINGTDIEILKTKIWRYFPRYPPSHMRKGVLWRILEMQGKYGMWYIGSSVSFESVKSVVEYNKLLVRNMKLPDKKKVV